MSSEPTSAPAADPGRWGDPQRQPFRHPGVNLTVDLVVTRDEPVTGRRQLLLVRRADRAGVAERGKWALPGGFMRTTAAPGQPFVADVESPRVAALRELAEETGVVLAAADVAPLATHLPLHHVGFFEGGERDPRDNVEAWSRSAAFRVHLPAADAHHQPVGGDDADGAAWFDLAALPELDLAFDHAAIVEQALHDADPVRAPAGANSGLYRLLSRPVQSAAVAERRITQLLAAVAAMRRRFGIANVYVVAITPYRTGVGGAEAEMQIVTHFGNQGLRPLIAANAAGWERAQMLKMLDAAGVDPDDAVVD